MKREMKDRMQNAGYEIECLFHTRRDRQNAIRTLEQFLGVSDSECYKTNDGRRWVIGRDSSLLDGVLIEDDEFECLNSGEIVSARDCDDCDNCVCRRNGNYCTIGRECYGLEISSPMICVGRDGVDEGDERALIAVVDILKDAGGFVNFSCGGHIHFSCGAGGDDVFEKAMIRRARLAARTDRRGLPVYAELFASIISPDTLRKFEKYMPFFAGRRFNDYAEQFGDFSHYSWVSNKNGAINGTHYEMRLFSGTLSASRIMRNVLVAKTVFNLALALEAGERRAVPKANLKAGCWCGAERAWLIEAGASEAVADYIVSEDAASGLVRK